MGSLELENLIAAVAGEQGVPVSIALALVDVESGFDTTAQRAEPRYRYLWNVQTGRAFRKLSPEEAASKTPPRDFPAPPGVSGTTEWLAQQTSWWLTQLMGGNARALGYRGKFLTGLCCDPYEGVRLGLLHLRKLANQYLPATGWPGVMAAYNAGSPRRAPGGAWENQDYVDKIERALRGNTLNGVWPK